MMCPQDLVQISLHVIEHHFNISLEVQLVKQKKRHSDLEKDKGDLANV